MCTKLYTTHLRSDFHIRSFSTGIAVVLTGYGWYWDSSGTDGIWLVLG